MNLSLLRAARFALCSLAALGLVPAAFAAPPSPVTASQGNQPWLYKGSDIPPD
ncbi:MAG: hypothetical protein RL367_561, partial [Pseudomonadota bacterium]